MKRIFTLLALLGLTLSIMAQSPDLMTYQAVLRDAGDNLLVNQAVAIQISILQGAPNGTAVYTEVHALNTNDNGLVSLVIGDGVTSDDFSTIDWSSGPYYLKTETDPAGGTNYTITSTTQLLSVPYSKYADEAGNVFSGAYGDLSGAPTNVSAFTNDAGYLTGITGSEAAFNGWDKDESDDFSGNYADLSGAPTNVSFFANDAGYLTSELWSQNGSSVYYNGGYVGIGTSTPIHQLSVSGGPEDTWATLKNNASGEGLSDGLLLGIRNDFNAFLWNFEAGPMFFGTNGTQRMLIDQDGNIAVGSHIPATRLDVRGGTKIGVNGVTFNELREVTGMTHPTNNWVSFTLPSGYNESNTRVLSVEINYLGDRWMGLGFENSNTDENISYAINDTSMYIYYPESVDYLNNRAFRVLIMQIAP